MHSKSRVTAMQGYSPTTVADLYLGALNLNFQGYGVAEKAALSIKSLASPWG